MHWKFRLWLDGQANEEPKVGEPFVDTVRNRIGNFFGGSTYRWLPRITDNGTRIDTGSNLSGMTSDTVENTLVLDFNTPGEIRVVDTANNNNVVARFTGNAAFLNNASVTGTFPFGGLVNQILNGNLTLVKPFNKVVNVSAANLSALVAPNWQLWCSAVNGGLLTATIDPSDVPPGSLNAISLTVNNPCYSGGLRTFVHSALPFVGKKCTFYSFIKGPSNATCKIRVLTDKGVIGVVSIIATGNWQQVSYSVDFAANPMPLGSTVIAFEPIYAPSSGATSNTWRVAGTQMNFGLNIQDLEVRSPETEKALIKGIYSACKSYITTTSYVSWDFIDNNVSVELDQAGGFTVSDVDSLGATIVGTGNLNKVSVLAYRFPTITA